MPIVQANSINQNSPSFYGVYIASGNGTIYAWHPFEFGSFDVGFTPTQYVGSKLDSNGSATECVEGLYKTRYVYSLTLLLDTDPEPASFLDLYQVHTTLGIFQ